MADDDVRFKEAVLRHIQEASQKMQETSQRLLAMEISQRELPRVFQVGEESGMSRHVPVHDAIPIVTTQAPARSTMPTFLPEDTGTGVRGGAQRDNPAPTRPTMPTFLVEDEGSTAPRDVSPAQWAAVFAE